MTTPARIRPAEDNLAWALRYAAAGMNVFPANAAKDPLVRWRKGDASQRATTDPATIEGWWARWPYADCGWALPEDVLVVDVDRKDGRDGFADFKRLFGCDPRDRDMPMTTSPSGGLHLFYRANKAYKNVAMIDETGLDTRSEGGLVLLPMPNNGRDWLKPFIGAELLPAPDWFDRVLRDAPYEAPRPPQPLSYDPRVREMGKTALERACNRIVAAHCGAQEATLNRECFSIGGMIGRGDVDYEEAHAALFQAAQAMPAYKKPWTGLSEHVDRSLEDGMARPMPTRDEETRRAFHVVSDNTEARMDGPQKPEKFALIPFERIDFSAHGEWLIKRILPRQGLVALYGPPRSYKSFLALNIAFHVALGWEWAGRKTTQGVAVYIAAENASGTRKRKAGFQLVNDAALPEGAIAFHLIEAAPNLGTDRSDISALIASVKAAGVAPALIVVDTLAQTLAGAEENSTGMVNFVSNCTTLANFFKCCVLVVHHVPLADDTRLRGHTSLHGGADGLLLTERDETVPLKTVLSLMKLKDEEDETRFDVHLERTVIGCDADNEEISTLVVARVEAIATGAGGVAIAGKTKKPAPSRRLLIEVTALAIEEAGRDIRSFSDGPVVRAASDEAVRLRYYARMAEKADPDEDPYTVAERKRQTYFRAVRSALAAKELNARIEGEERFLWLP
jgi:hypothetical protein